ncbi:ACP S-malonyltransferase [Paenibacillus tyrfis]|uniref:[acyl-carrier-protein] S-malonyltransferase n=1 Tax=Paenibacillus tyrfis TaxID=1501230 RepID=A0A081NVN1_9BACL|nr:ACP S-malonyltransferase [Paenibacillus tyrfis]KEQ22504.1 malonyl CoA-acyl carrier protein transacylase [Paenibacillus tyrfis]
MGKPVVFLFSGQGSQFYQMGRGLYEEVSEFRKWMNKLDEMVTPLVGESVLARLYAEDKRRDEPFERTLLTHPVIFMVEYALALALMARGVKPDAVLGSSMGEFAAAAVAGVLDVEVALELVVEQAKAFEATCLPGGMIGILQEPSLYDRMPLLRQNTEMASINSDAHFVVAGPAAMLPSIGEALREKGIAYQILPVSFAYHSSWIDPAAASYVARLRGLSYRQPWVRFYSGVTGRRETALRSEYFWEVARQPIRFAEAVQALEQGDDCLYVDLGPSGTLANLAKRNFKQDSLSQSYAVLTPYQQDLKNFNKVCEQLEQLISSPIRKGGQPMKAYVFPGQGSQHKGMGGTLFDEFADLMAQADEILGYSIKRLCLEDPDNQLGQTQYTQPALYVVSALSFLKKVQETGCKPDYVAGHSLGEYNALFAAGAFDFATGLRMVKKRGELMSLASGGGMAAVIGFTVEQIDRVLMENGLDGIDIANHNSPDQIVIAGLKTDILRAQPFFEEAGVRMYIPLNVSGAFHSRYMAESKRSFEAYLESFEFSKLEIPVISNIYACPYKQRQVKDNLVQQIVSPVKWTDSVRYLMGLGEIEIEEVGPGNVLTKLVTTIRRKAEPLVIEPEADDVEEAEEAVLVAVAASVTVPEVTKASIAEVEVAVAVEAPAAAPAPAPVEVVPVREAVSEPIVRVSRRASTAESLGDEEFKKDYNLKYAYVTGSMYRGVASERLVIQVGKAGMLGFYGTGGMKLEQIEQAIRTIQQALTRGEAYGMNLLHNQGNPSMEDMTVDLFLRTGVRNVEASAYMAVNSALVRYRAKGLKRSAEGGVIVENRILAKVSRPEVAEAFLSPAPERIVDKLLLEQRITREEADLLREVPMADDITVEADSGGHTDQGVSSVLLPSIVRLRDEMMAKYGYKKKIRIGAAGGIGTPEAAVATLVLGADYLVTGSINQCTVEAQTSESVKDLLQEMNVQDTAYAPAGDMFEIGARVQVLKKGVFFPARANKLYDLYRQFNSLEEIDEKTRRILQERYFKRSFDEVYREVQAYVAPQEIEKAERNPKHKMALIFKWYFGYSSRMALSGDAEHTVDYQVHCGPSLGAFNRWVKGTPLESWRARHVDVIGEKLMRETADLLNRRISELVGL